MSEKIYLTYSAEIELALTGRYHPYVREEGPSYSSGGQPAEEAFVEDVDIEGVTFERRERKYDISRPVHDRFHTVVTKFDLLKGLDKAARDILIANIVEAIGDDAAAEMLQDHEAGMA